MSPRWIAAVILLLGIGLRLYRLDAQSLWTDEFGTIEQSSGHSFAHLTLERGQILDGPPDLTSLASAAPWWTIGHDMDHDDHPPLFVMTLRAWRELFGSSVATMRGLSVVASAGALWLLFETALLLGGPATALWGALIMAVAGTQIQYAQEIRGYALLLFFEMASCYLIASIERQGASIVRLLLLAAMAIAAMLTHYFAVFPLAALAIYAAVQLPRLDRRRTMIALAAAAAIYTAIWGPGIMAQLPYWGRDMVWAREAGPAHAGRTLLRLLALPVFLCFKIDPLAMRDSYYLPAIAGLAAYVVPPLFIRRYRPLLLWWGLLASLALFLAAFDLLTFKRHLAFIRFALTATPGVYMLAPAVAAAITLRRAKRSDTDRTLTGRVPRWAPHLLPAIVAVACLTHVSRGYEFAFSPEKPDMRATAAYLDGRTSPADGMVLIEDTTVIWDVDANFAMVLYYMMVKPNAVCVMNGPPSPEVLARLRECRSVWLMARTVPGGIPLIFGPAQILEDHPDAATSMRLIHIKLAPIPPGAVR